MPVRIVVGVNWSEEGKGRSVDYFAKNLSEYVDKIKLRGVSSLKEVSDDEYQEGLVNLEKGCYENETGRAVLEDIDLLVFQAT